MAQLKYPRATFSIDEPAFAAWLETNHPQEPKRERRIRKYIQWLARNGDRAGAASYPFVTSVTLGPSSR